LPAMLVGEAQDALVIGDERAGQVDRGCDQQSIRRVAVLQMIESIAARGGPMPERRGSEAGALKESRDPRSDRQIQLDPPGIDE